MVSYELNAILRELELFYEEIFKEINYIKQISL